MPPETPSHTFEGQPFRPVLWVLKALVLTAVLVTGMLNPAQPMAQRQAEPPVRLAYTEFAPYSFTGPDGTAQGLAIDLARRLLEPEGRSLQAIAAPNPASVIDLLNRGEADMSALLGQTAARAQLAGHTSSVGALSAVIFAKKADAARTPSSFSGQRIGVVSGSVGVSLVDAVPFAEVVEQPNLDRLIMAMMTEQVDAVIAPSDGFHARMRLMGIDPLVEEVLPPLARFPFVFYVSPSQPGLLSALEDEITQGLSPAELRALDEIWFGVPTRPIEREIILWGSLAFAFLALATLAALRGSFVHARRAKRLSKETEESRLLIDALNAVDAAIVIFDQDLRAVHWNTGFFRAFPTMVDRMENGVGYRALIAECYMDGSIAAMPSKEEAEDMADSMLRKLTTGQTTRRMIRSVAGRVFEAADFRIGAHHYASVRVDMSRLYDQAELIREQKTKLETVNEQLERFSTLAAHDLKGPLLQQSALLGFIEEDMSEAMQAYPGDVAQNLHIMRTLCGRMTQLVGDLLEQAQTDQDSELPRRFQPRDRLPAILQLAGIPASFDVEVASDMPEVTLMPAAFDTVLRNLISNAAKHHNAKEGSIRVTGHCEGNWVVIEVADDGPGIPDAHRARIFEPFQRLSTTKEGFGLGLAFIQKTVTSWGGEISVSCPPSGGSVFRFTIPKVPAALLALKQPQLQAGKPH